MLVWDEQALLGRCNKKPERVIRLITMFLEDIPTHLEELKTSIAADNNEALNRQAHSLKGMAANLGALKLQEVAFDLEQCYTQAVLPRPRCNELTHTLYGEIDALTKELQGFLNRNQ